MSKTLFLSKEEMQGYGCRNCVWKSYHQCPYKFTEPDQSLKDGYCEKLHDFIMRMGEPDDNITAIKEKFHLYIQSMQVMADHSKFSQLTKEYTKRRNDGVDRKELARLEMEIHSYKLWWARLSDSYIKGTGRIADREQKQNQKIEIDHKISLTQIHQLANDAKQQIEKSEDKIIEVDKSEKQKRD